MEANHLHYFVYILGGQPRSEVRVGIADSVNHVLDVSSAPSSANSTVKGSNLVYYEHYNAEEVALARERHIKSGGNDIAYSLIESMNPNWLDLSDTLA